MTRNENRWHTLLSLSEGQTLTEYSLIILAVGLAAFTAFLDMGRGMNVVTNNLIAFLNTAISAL